MLDVSLERMRAYQKNIDRYRRLLATHLSDLERSYIERRLSEEQASMRGLLQETFPDRLSAGLPRIEGQTSTLEMAVLLHPAAAFTHPMDVVDDCDLTAYEKRAILSSWAADICLASDSYRPLRGISFDDVLDALHLLESTSGAPTSRKGSGKQLGAHRSGNSAF
jgi:hypothetical protein